MSSAPASPIVNVGVVPDKVTPALAVNAPEIVVVPDEVKPPLNVCASDVKLAGTSIVPTLFA